MVWSMLLNIYNSAQCLEDNTTFSRSCHLLQNVSYTFHSWTTMDQGTPLWIFQNGGELAKFSNPTLSEMHNHQ